MSMDADAIVDRRRLKRRLAVWRILAVVAIVGAVAAVAWRGGGGPAVGDYVAELDLNGVLLDDPDRTEAVRALVSDPAARALLVRIDSPGGTAVAGETLYRAIREVAAEKPVVAVIAGMGASAGYLVALAADHVIARETSITGSIGVRIQTAEISELLARLGVSAESIKSTELKDQPSPFTPLTPAGRAATQAVVNDMYRWFVDLVAERRGLSPATALQLADGRIYSGRQAQSLSLIDGVGGMPEARTWLLETHGVSDSLELRPVEHPRGVSVTVSLLEMARKTLFSEALRLDGLWALWQPDAL
ncbi:MAG: signal peptide peptidase SppA [Proteobacteria bacterium]|nr:signal peptide peptidase SppA [Pseudomonadota bacterium]